jgi:hypothetical protein
VRYSGLPSLQKVWLSRLVIITEDFPTFPCLHRPVTIWKLTKFGAAQVPTVVRAPRYSTDTVCFFIFHCCGCWITRLVRRKDFRVISIGRCTPLQMSLPTLESSPQVQATLPPFPYTSRNKLKAYVDVFFSFTRNLMFTSKIILASMIAGNLKNLFMRKSSSKKRSVVSKWPGKGWVLHVRYQSG